MKKLVSILMVLAMLLVTSASLAEAMTGMPNPMTECASLDEVNAITGCRMEHPGVMGVTDESFFVIDCGDYKIGEYNYTVNGMEFCFRCCDRVTHDISGVYINGNPAFGDAPEAEIEYAFDDTFKLARWFTLEGQYCLTLKNGADVDFETFESIVEEMVSMTAVGMTETDTSNFYAEIAGEYSDRFSQRAYAQVTANGSENASVYIRWGSSAAEYTTWEMTVTLGEDGLLYYNDCTRTDYVCHEDETETPTVVFTDGEGFFGYNDGVLAWTGAAEESCVDCEFVKYA